MSDSVFLGLGRWMIPIPGMVWRRVVRANASQISGTLRFMTADHHRLRDFAVDRLFRAGVPLSPDEIARSLNLSPRRVGEILDDLERHLTFLFRRSGPEVTWAYPVTVDETPHRAIASTGEEAYSP
ncbi:MAG: hypothetical protein ACHQ9S_00485 [Candidatus Binatia bacterium]